MLAVPTDRPVTKPDELPTAATELLTVHVPPDGEEDNEPVPPMQ
jgi:hypothetical protein